MPTFVYMTSCDGCGHCVDICPSDIMHIDPVTRAIMLNSNPEGARLFAIIEKFLFLNIKIPKLKIEIKENIPSDIHAEGTCTYIIRTESPCL